VGDMKERGKLSYLLICILIMLLVYPFFLGQEQTGKLFAILFTLVLISGVYAVSGDSRIKRMLALIFSIPTVVLVWAEQLKKIYIIDLLALAFMTAFCFFVIYCILDHIMKSKKVTKDILAGAASAYLLLGISWGILFMLIEFIKPGSFLMANTLQEISRSWTVYNYYSFTTLTTLGYGDITPVTIYAQSIAVMEAVTGVLFVALLISRLVGMHIYQMQKEERTAIE
jgi:hypothetical protein